VPIVRVTDVRDGRVSTHAPLRIGRGIEQKYSRTRLRGGELVLSLVGTVGECAVVPPTLAGWNTARAIAVVPLRPDVDARWVYYCLRSSPIQHLIRTWCTTSVQATLNLAEVNRIPIPIPPVDEQRAIVRILGALDDKIELNRATNATLEAIARALFKSWFVDFDPVRAKMHGRRPAGMDDATAALFPDAFESTEVGPVPRGWRIVSLGDCVTLQRGTTYKSALLELPGPFLLGLASIQRNGGFRRDSLRTYGGESPEKLLVRGGELFASLKDVTQAGDLLGAVARLPRWLGVGRLTQDTVKLDLVADVVPSEIVYRLLLTPAVREYFRARAIGTTNLALSREDFLAYKFAMPAPESARPLARFIEVITEKTEHLNESASLAQLRDALLPKLMSGEVRVRDAERAVENAT
jgi:type I restriction enzyme, S subunit